MDKKREHAAVQNTQPRQARAVVAALIWQEGRFMACQRPAHKTRGLLWEFVGGKVEPGESREEALIRECREELDITVAVQDVFMELEHVYPDMTVHLTLFNAAIAQGTPRLLEHKDLRWLTPEEAVSYPFCPADTDILARLREEGGVYSVRSRLLSLGEEDYARFQCALMPTVPPEKVIGVRMPKLRQLACQLRGSGEAAQFLARLPHRYYEEDNLHALLIGTIKDFDAALSAWEGFLPWVDNWATCDMPAPAAFRREPQRLLPSLRRWLGSDHAYTQRFAIKLLMDFYLDDNFSPSYPEWVANINSNNYYVNMMAAWYFATALARRYEDMLPWLEEQRLGQWVHNKTIQKAVESRRIPPERKAYLRTLRRT